METERIEKLLTMLLLEQIGEGQQVRKIMALSRAGLDPKEIATAVGTSSHAVSQRIFEARRTARKPRKAAKTRRS